MQPFLEEITDYILAHHGSQTGDLCVVTPNRRASLFFRKYFSNRVQKVTWSPDTLSIEDFINRISGLTVIDSTSMLFHFYEVYSRLEQDDAKPVDDFIRWAPVLLNDMDEIDAHLDDPGQIYSALKDIKRIETWNPDGSPLTEFQKNYLAFFGKLESWHRALSASLLARRLAGQGLSSRQAARIIAREDFSLPWDKVLFTGFNALNQCEELIIRTLLRRGQAVFLTDGDPYYVDDPGHEAGLFIRQTRQRLGLTATACKDHLRSGRKNIHLLGIAKNVNQARLAGNILLQNPVMSRDEQTAIVLANEKLLIPVLSALPADIDKVNVTMGYPLSKTNIFGFFDALWKLYVQQAGSGGDERSAPKKLYYKDLVRFFTHSCAGLLWKAESGSSPAAGLAQMIRSENKTFYSFEEIAALCDDKKGFHEGFHFLDLPATDEVQPLIATMTGLVKRFDTLLRSRAASSGGNIVNTPYFVDFEALYFLGGLLRRLQGFLDSHAFLQNKKTLYTLFRQLSEATRLSFSGEPLEGLQVMGMLETRNLDFKHVILLSANENIIPRAKSNTSFIPFDVKKRFGLHVHTEKDAIYAYHFYRLLQRAENVYLIYNTQTEDIGSSEKSRFLTQLQLELSQYASAASISEHIVSLPPPQASVNHGMAVIKTPELLDRLKEICTAGISPSALNTFISCPLHFYLTRVAGIKEAEEVEETIEASTLGTVVHKVLESLYRPFEGTTIKAVDYESMLQQTAALTRQTFFQYYKGGDITSGKNLLLFNLARRYSENFLREERLRSAEAVKNGKPPFTVLAVEQKLSARLEVTVNGQTFHALIKGLADRIDRIDGTVRIIDYKSGKVQPNELKFDEWELVGNDSRYGKVFQLLTYAWLYSRGHSTAMKIEPGIISLRETGKGLQTMIHPEGQGLLSPLQVNRFEAELKGAVQKILDPDIPFTRTDNEDNCRYCPFSKFCRRF